MPAPKLPDARPNLDTLIDIALGVGSETNRFDFKQVLDLKNDEHRLKLIRAIASFGNTDGGGFLVIGVSDDRKLMGLAEDVAKRYDQTAVSKIIAAYLAPVPAIQVRHHTRAGKRLVIIEIDSFVDVPSIVSQSATYGKEKLVAGTILFRNAAAQSTVVASESDLRVLCDAIARRRAAAIAELVRGPGIVGAASGPPRFQSMDELRAHADGEWRDSHTGAPFVEVGFCSEYPLALSQPDLRRVLENAPIRIQHGFPFVHVGGYEIHRATKWGWYGRIPFAELGVETEAPSHFWLLSRQGAFLDRNELWEDGSNSPIRGAVGLFHVVGRTILVLRFLHSFAQELELSDAQVMRVSVAASGIRGRQLRDETGSGRNPGTRGAAEDRLESQAEVTLGQLRASALPICTTLIEDLTEQFGREDLRRHQIELLIARAATFLGPEYAFPVDTTSGLQQTAPAR